MLGSNLAPQPESTGLAGLTSSDLALASLLPKPGSGAGGSNSILLLSSAMQQPIYVFENGKFLQSYGKGLGGTPITIGYDSKNQQYFGFTNKGSSNSGSIFEAISASSNGKYSADILRGVVQPIPVADTTPPKPPSQPTPQPKPLSQSELSAAQFLVDTLTANKQELQAKQNEYHRTILQIANQNMRDAEVKKLARDETLMQQASAVGGDMGLDYDPRAKKFIEEHPKTALALGLLPYAGIGVGLLGETAIAATRLLPTIAAEGGGGSSIFGGSQLANAGSRLFMTEAAGVGSNVGARIGSTAATATPINPLYTTLDAVTAAAIVNYGSKAIEDTYNLLGGNSSTDIVSNQSQPVAEQPVKIGDVTKPLPANINPCAVIDQAVNKPTILTTPIPSEKPVTTLSTPDQRDILQKLGTLPGFSPAPSELTRGLVESFPDHSDLANSMNILYKKQYPDTVEKINERFPINADLAGQKYPLSPELEILFPEGVWFKENGHPDFSPYADITLEIEGLTGVHGKDEKMANKKAGLLETPDDKTWHHVEDGKTLQLIPWKLHNAVNHTGGSALQRSKNKK
ncbi:HNH endonuclease [Candidatus Tisiphia endosymbiont of Piscicola geometra]|uniref:HNH endonuclease n=1 Tax=Candidatus Tisiphia endosymbiont of Piscicola geometra TaxID=3066273 RepID=UPI00312C7CAC